MTAYEIKLNQILDDVFVGFKDWTLEEIAKKAKLALSTVWRIEQRITKLPRFKTVYLLAKAAGFELTVELNKRIRLRAV